VRARKAVVAAALARGETVPPVLPRLAALAHKDSEAGGQAGDPDPRYPPALTDSNTLQIPKFNVRNAKELNEALTLIRKGLPVVLRQCPLLGELTAGTSRPGLLASWTFERLASESGDQKGPRSQWDALVSAADKNRFISYSEGKNVFGSYYHVREPETERMPTSLREFVQCARTWTTRRIFLKALLMQQSVKDAEDCGSVPKPQENVPKGMAEALEKEVHWEWLKDVLLQPCGFGGVVATMLTCCMRDGLLPAHYVAYETLHAQLRGRRRILLIDPAQSYKGMYPYPTAHTYDRQSMVDLDKPDYDDWPKFAQVKGQVCILEPGDVLYAPMWWWRHVQELEDEGIALEFGLHQKQRVRQAAMVPLSLGRIIEDRIATAENMRDTKHWIQTIANAEEADYIDLSTPKGHKRMMLVQSIRDECDNCLGLGKWQEFLRELIDRRLDPTPWLNVNFREPLYLHDVPIQHEDTRNELEQKFPEFFYNKLTQEGYNVERTPVSVFNPQHPDFIHKDNPNYQNQLRQGGGGRQ